MFSHDTTFWIVKAANFCSQPCQNWGNFKYEGFIQKCKQTGNFPKTLFLMIIQSKSNILSQFQNSRLVFTAKSDFHQNSCDMELKMAGALQGQFFQPFLWPMVSTIIGQKFWGVLLRLLRWHFSAVPNFRTVSVKSFDH